jgi:hypothetical protein
MSDQPTDIGAVVADFGASHALRAQMQQVNVAVLQNAVRSRMVTDGNVVDRAGLVNRDLCPTVGAVTLNRPARRNPRYGFNVAGLH